MRQAFLFNGVKNNIKHTCPVGTARGLFDFKQSTGRLEGAFCLTMIFAMQVDRTRSDNNLDFV